MSQTIELTSRIEIMRSFLQHLLMQKQDLQDPDVITFSKELDKKLNEYYKLYEMNIF